MTRTTNPIFGLTLLALSACSGGVGSDGTASGSLDDDGQLLLSELIEDIVRDALDTLSYSHGQDVGWSATLLGSDQSMVGAASMMFPCDAPVQYDAYCEPAGVDGFELDVCLRVSCVAEGTWGSESWYTERSASDPTGPQPVSYDAELFEGTLSWDESPHRFWEISDLGTGVAMSGAPSGSVDADFGDTTLSITYDGTLTAANAPDGGLTAFQMSLDLPSLPDGAGVVELSLDSAGEIVGQVDQGGAVLAEIAHAENGFAFTWAE